LTTVFQMLNISLRFYTIFNAVIQENVIRPCRARFYATFIAHSMAIGILRAEGLFGCRTNVQKWAACSVNILVVGFTPWPR
jgi:hypothetical protein